MLKRAFLFGDLPESLRSILARGEAECSNWASRPLPYNRTVDLEYLADSEPELVWQELGDPVVGDHDPLFFEVSVLVEDLLLIVLFGNDHREVVFILDHKPVDASHDIRERRFLGRCASWGTCECNSDTRQGSKSSVRR